MASCRPHLLAPSFHSATVNGATSFNCDLSRWNVAQVKNMNGMCKCSNPLFCSPCAEHAAAAARRRTREPVEQIKAFAKWAVNDAEKVENMKGEECVVVAQKLLPRTSSKGNPYFMGVTSDPKPTKKDEKAAWDF